MDTFNAARAAILSFLINVGARGASLVVLPCMLLCACGGVSEPLERAVEQTCPLDPDAKITIRNRDGSIEVYGSDKPELHVEATIRAYTAERLNSVSVHVAAQSNFASITTTFPPARTWGFSDRSGTVDYVIVVPSTANIPTLELQNGEILIKDMEDGRIHAALENGRLLARNSFAEMNLRVGAGALTVLYDWWLQQRCSVDATIKNGNAYVTMPGDASFHVVAQSPNGRITNDFADQEQRSESASRKTEMVSGTAPTADLKIRAQNGNVQIIEANP